jgi:hypothetical protein
MLHSVAAGSHRLRRIALAGAVTTALMLASIAMAVRPGVASANWDLKSLPGKTWTIVENISPGLHYQYAHGETSSTLCVGPIQKSGGGYVAPYGWGCHAGGEVEWEYSPIEAGPAVYNPNSGTIYNLYGVSYF